MTVVTLVGAPWDRSSSFQRGAADAPAAIRQALWSESSNTWNERGDNLAAPGVLEDAGDAVVSGAPVEARAAIEQRVRDVLAAGHRPIVLGGDHSITYPYFGPSHSAPSDRPSSISMRTAISTIDIRRRLPATMTRPMRSRAIRTPVPLPASWRSIWPRGSCRSASAR